MRWEGSGRRRRWCRGSPRSRSQTDIDCVLVGDEARIQPMLEATAYNPERIDIVHAGEVIGLQEDPRDAVRYKRNKASLLVALREVAQGRCAAAVTAGNPGAAIVASLRELTLLPGVAQGGDGERLPARRRGSGPGSAGAGARRRRDRALRRPRSSCSSR